MACGSRAASEAMAGDSRAKEARGGFEMEKPVGCVGLLYVYYVSTVYVCICYFLSYNMNTVY
jgi:hypothetical protein